jgi:hypothetical protein
VEARPPALRAKGRLSIPTVTLAGNGPVQLSATPTSAPTVPITARKLNPGVVLTCVGPLEGGRICPRWRPHAGEHKTTEDGSAWYAGAREGRGGDRPRSALGDHLVSIRLLPRLCLLAGRAVGFVAKYPQLYKA